MELIRCDHLSLGYEGREIIRDLTFSVSGGDYLCILGENGAGKSTLLRTLLGLQPPLRGTVTLGDAVAPGDIGYLPQQTPVQRDFPASVWEVVLSGCQGRCRGPFYSADHKRAAAEALERLNAASLRHRCYRELSGGQQQRVLLARSLCAARRLLLLDEPAAGLDPVVTAELYHVISRLHREGMTIVMISHDVAAAAEYASHVLHLGREVFFGTREAYLRSTPGRRFAAAEGEGRRHDG